MRCIDKECNYRELNGGDEISDFYFCKHWGIAVNRGEDECLVDKWFFGEQEIEDEHEDGHPCNTCSKADYCDGWDAQFCCTLCYYYSDDPDCENCDPMDI